MSELAHRMLRPFVALLVVLGIGFTLYPVLTVGRDDLAGRLSELRSGSIQTRQRVAEELGSGNAGDVAKVMTGLIAALDDPDAGVRTQAAHSLGRNLVLHPNATQRDVARAALERTLGDRDASVRGASAIALALIGGESDALVAGLVDALRGDDPIVRGEAQASLASLGVKTDARVSTLLGLLREERTGVRDAAARLLAQVEPGPDPEARTKLVLAALNDERPQARRVAASVLGRVGKGRPEASVALVQRLADTDASVRVVAASSLATFVEDDQVRESLQRAIDDDPDREVRVAAAATLCRRRPPSSDESRETLADTLRAVGEHAELAQAIAPGPGALDPTPALIAALSDPDARVRAAVATTLGQTGSQTDSTAQAKSQAVAALAPLLRDQTTAVAIAATEALGRLGKAARPAIPELSEASQHGDRRLSAFAAAVLNRVDPPVSRGD